MILSKTYYLTRKPPNTSSGLAFVRKHFLMCIIHGRAYIRRRGRGGGGLMRMTFEYFRRKFSYTLEDIFVIWGGGRARLRGPGDEDGSVLNRVNLVLILNS